MKKRVLLISGIFLSLIILLIISFNVLAQPRTGQFQVGNVAPDPAIAEAVTSGTNELSDADHPTNDNQAVTFRATTTDPNGNKWYILVCKTDDPGSGACTAGNEICADSTARDSNTRSSCDLTLSPASQTSSWYAYACDSVTPPMCTPLTEEPTQYNVNHRPRTALTGVDISITPSPAHTNNDLTCNHGFYDSDGDTQDTPTNAYQWWINGAQDMDQTSNTLSNNLINSGDEVYCCVRVRDIHSYSYHDTNYECMTSPIIIQNTPPTASEFRVQDYGPGTQEANFDNGQGHDDTPTIIDTHMLTPMIRWTNFDLDGNTVTNTLCLSSTSANDCNLLNIPGLSNSYQIASGVLNYYDLIDSTPEIYYVRIIPNDGTANGANLDSSFSIINDVPSTSNLDAITDNAYSTKPGTATLETHQRQPTAGFPDSIDADTTVGIDHYPQDTLTYHFTSVAGATLTDAETQLTDGSVVAGQVLVSSFDYATAGVTIPWSTTQDVDWTKRIVYTTIWVTDDNDQNPDDEISNSGNTNGQFTLYDFLPDVIVDNSIVNPSPTGLQITSWNYETNSLFIWDMQSVFGRDCNLAGFGIRVLVKDTDGDCNLANYANINSFICDPSITVCDETTRQYGLYSLTFISRKDDNKDECYFISTAPIEAIEFWKPTSSPAGTRDWKIGAQILENLLYGSGIERTADAERDTGFEYVIAKSIDYPDVIYLGAAQAGYINLGAWNSKPEPPAPDTMRNCGNAELNLLWNIDDPRYCTDANWNAGQCDPVLNPGNIIDMWTTTGTDFQLDDDNNNPLVDPTDPRAVFLGDAIGQTSFNPLSGALQRCIGSTSTTACQNPTELESILNTYYHIFPPLGLEQGTYRNYIIIGF